MPTCPAFGKTRARVICCGGGEAWNADAAAVMQLTITTPKTKLWRTLGSSDGWTRESYLSSRPGNPKSEIRDLKSSCVTIARMKKTRREFINVTGATVAGL